MTLPGKKSIKPPMAPQKQRRMVTSQMQQMITTEKLFSWKHNAVKYLYNTLTACVSNAKCSWLQHEHKRKYIYANENFLKNKGRYYD